LDGIYKTMLLLKKKKYAALMMTNQNGKLVTTKEVKVG
jgi:DNA polymerase elongation subunit (family B)